jgi:PHD/YefM family antitoxin component YafN of YafNO toxin-antitoxin module
VKFDNSQGKIFYGMHFYPGVARYEAPDKEPLTVFINEDTIRNMGPTFAGRPVFVEHVEEVDDNVNELRKEADGWVIESFFNQADGKNWAKFIIVSDRGYEAIRRGYRLSNAYIPQLSQKGGVWNGVDYQSEVINGEFEHLAIVKNPRYEESVILTPEEFKNYNDEKTVELKRLSNSNNRGERKMKLNIFKRTKVENSVDLDGMIVELPKSKKEISLTKVVDEYDKILNMNGYANGDHMVKVGEKDEMSVNDLVKKHLAACNELEGLKKNASREDGGEPGPDDKDADDSGLENDDEDKRVASGEKDVGDRGGDDSLDNEEDNEDESEDKKKKMKNDVLTISEAKKILAKEKAARLKNANLREHDEEIAIVSLPADQVARGRALYGTS